MMRFSFNSTRSLIFFMTAAVFAELIFPHPAWTAFEVETAAKPVIVIDPGHGGHDSGAIGPEGTLEKSVTLHAARILSQTLEPAFRVYLTRDDDYWVNLSKRPAVANHYHADLFVSLHTGAAFMHRPSGLNIYYYGNPGISTLDATSPIAASSESVKNGWDQLQLRHVEGSESAARILQRQFSSRAISCNILEAPIISAVGADMPAILVEIGYITNPAEEKQLQKETYLKTLCQIVREGIELFFKEKRTKFIGLHQSSNRDR